jgi:hypothetical protein
LIFIVKKPEGQSQMSYGNLFVHCLSDLLVSSLWASLASLHSALVNPRSHLPRILSDAHPVGQSAGLLL